MQYYFSSTAKFSFGTQTLCRELCREEMHPSASLGSLRTSVRCCQYNGSLSIKNSLPLTTRCREVTQAHLLTRLHSRIINKLSPRHRRPHGATRSPTKDTRWRVRL